MPQLLVAISRSKMHANITQVLCHHGGSLWAQHNLVYVRNPRVQCPFVLVSRQIVAPFSSFHYTFQKQADFVSSTLTDGQSATILWGWVLVSLISLAIAASLAEICAVYPTAGGVYYWSAMLSTPKYAPVASWVTGWLTLVGNWTVTLSINFSGGQLILSAITLWKEDFVPNQYQTILMFWAVMLVCMCVNIFGAKYLDLINKICIYWTASSVIIIIVTLLAMADNRRSGEFVFGHYDASASGW